MGTLPVSPLAPTDVPEIPEIPGVRLATGRWCDRYAGRPNLLLVALDKGTTVAGRFTRSAMPSAPVDWCKSKIGRGTAQALIVNAGNANAFAGSAGHDAAKETAAAASALLECPKGAVMLASTGVIGEPLDASQITALLPDLTDQLSATTWHAAAQAIRTTDTFAKLAFAEAEIDGQSVKIGGIAKGSGMIAPNMGTMLAFLFTDAAIPADILDELLGKAVNQSFNAITVDSDTSTSDTVLMFATGKTKHKASKDASGKRLKQFRKALEAVCLDLALQIVRDGEGAKKLIGVTVEGAKSKASAKRIALAIANSPLVKTAFAGEDANWGRVVMAIGKAGEPADRDKLAIWFGDHQLAKDGAAIDGYDEAPVAAYMKGAELSVRANVGVGKASATVWTCDLTHGYIDINADYRS